MIPLMAAGFEPTKPKDMHFMSSYKTGSIYFGFYYDALNVSFSLLINVGSEGP
jgi:hypothetical protein